MNKARHLIPLVVTVSFYIVVSYVINIANIRIGTIPETFTFLYIFLIVSLSYISIDYNERIYKIFWLIMYFMIFFNCFVRLLSSDFENAHKPLVTALLIFTTKFVFEYSAVTHHRFLLSIEPTFSKVLFMENKIKELLIINVKLLFTSFAYFLSFVLLSSAFFGFALSNFLKDNETLTNLLSQTGLPLAELVKYSISNYKYQENYLFFNFIDRLQNILLFFMLSSFIMPKFKEIKSLVKNKKNRVYLILFMRKFFKLSVYFYIILCVFKISVIYMFGSYLDDSDTLIDDEKIRTMILLKYIVIYFFIMVFLMIFLSSKSRIEIVKNKNKIFLCLLMIFVIVILDFLLKYISIYLNFVLVNFFALAGLCMLYMIIKNITNFTNENLGVIFIIQLYFFIFIIFFNHYEIFKIYFTFIFVFNLMLLKNSFKKEHSFNLSNFLNTKLFNRRR